MLPKLTVDFDANAAYLKLRDGDVAKTCTVSPGVLVDQDEMDLVIGVEVLVLDAQIPYADLTRKHHIHSDDLKVLELIRPNVTSFMSRQSVVESRDPASDRFGVPC